MMAYASWSVVFGEQPSAAKWNILGTNDASFNDGTGIAGLYINLLTTYSNPYKFSAYRNAAYNTASSSATRFPFDTENFDTNNNFDITTNVGRYTAPVSGFYFFDALITLGASATRAIPIFYKNGAEIRRGTDVAATNYGMGTSMFLQLSASDYIEVYYFVDAVRAVTTGQACQFSGILLAKT